MNIRNLLLMAVLHFAAMYLLMYSMVDNISSIYPSLNQFYMAGVMTAPMLVIEALLMGSMYNKKAITTVAIISVIAFVVFFTFIRRQTGIKDEEFLRSMIPHHSGAILMCKRSTLENEEVLKLCDEIIESQRTEIETMENLLAN